MSKRIIVAPSGISNSFDSATKQMFTEADCLMRVNRNLRRTRDLLLPKLISGEIDVSNFDTRM